MAQHVMQQILQTGRVQRGRIGVSVQDLPVTQRGRRAEGGALIAEVANHTPAEQAGLQKGDIVVLANGVAVRSAAQLRNKVA
jgi:serine protease Do